MSESHTEERDAAVDIIEAALVENGRQWRSRDRAEGAADDLRRAGLLAGTEPRRGSGTVREQAAAILQCRYDWSMAERITAQLADAGLLETDEPRSTP